MLTAELIKQKALEYGAAAVGIGDIEGFWGAIPQRDPKMILPRAKCVVGFLFRFAASGGQGQGECAEKQRPNLFSVLHDLFHPFFWNYFF